MKVIGLTGGTGSGKSVVSKHLAAAGAVIVDADRIAHEILWKDAPAYHEIVAYYGTGILDEDGNIIRKKLGEIVFNDKEKLAFLNQSTHKYIVAEINRQIAAAKTAGETKAIIIDAPLLLEAGLEKVCDLVWVVYAAPEVRAKRVMERDGITMELAMARIANQKSWLEYRAAASTVIDNSGSLDELEEQLSALLNLL